MSDLRQREARERDKPYLAWVARLRCLPCLCLHGTLNRGVEVCHIRMSNAEAGWFNAGLQQKPHDRRTFPACPEHHRHGKDSQHHWGDEAAWWAWIGVDPVALVDALNAAFDAKRDGNAVLATFAARARRTRGAAGSEPQHPS